MKSLHLMHAFVLAVVSLSNMLALPNEETTPGILLSTVFMVGCAAMAGHNLHLYLTQPKDKK